MRKRAVVGAVLLFVCAAVYMNWRYAGSWRIPQGTGRIHPGIREKTGETALPRCRRKRKTTILPQPGSAASRPRTTPSTCSRMRPQMKMRINRCSTRPRNAAGVGELYRGGVADREPGHGQGLCRLCGLHGRRERQRSGGRSGRLERHGVARIMDIVVQETGYEPTQIKGLGIRLKGL